MAVRHGYGKIAGTDALVFAYDTGDTRNSYRGEPTVNYIAHQNAVAQSSYTSYSATSNGTWNAKHSNAIRAYNIDGGDITVYINTGVGDWTNTYHAHWQYDIELGKPVAVMQALDGNWKAKSFGAGMGAWSSLGMSAGQKYTISWLQWTSDLNLCADTGFYSRNTSNTWGFHDGRSNGNSKNTLLNTWQRVSYTFTVNAVRNLNDSNGNVYMYGHTTSNIGGTLKIADVQLELKDHATQFTGLTSGTNGRTTRSSTQGLLDLTGNSTIDLANVSFDANAQMFFDGTDDRIILPPGSLPTIGTNDFTLEFVCKNTRTNSYNHFFSVLDQYHISFKSYNVNGLLYVYRTSALSTTNSIPAYIPSRNDYYHIVAKRQGDNMQIYINGESQGVKTGWGDVSIDNNLYNSYIGWGAGTEYSGGHYAIAKIYNRALTAAEVRNNYNQYKGRFNL